MNSTSYNLRTSSARALSHSWVNTLFFYRMGGMRVRHSTYKPWLKGQSRACLHGSRQRHPSSLSGISWALDELVGWQGCRSYSFTQVWSYRKVSLPTLQRALQPSVVLLCSWFVSGRPSPTLLCSTHVLSLGLHVPLLLRTHWETWLSVDRSKLRPSMNWG